MAGKPDEATPGSAATSCESDGRRADIAYEANGSPASYVSAAIYATAISCSATTAATSAAATASCAEYTREANGTYAATRS